MSSQLQNLQSLELKGFSHLLAPDTALKAGIKTPIPTLTDVIVSTKTLAGMCSDFRTFTRLWGLLGVYALSKKQYFDPPKDAVLKAVSLAQILSLGSYYVYENAYYLASKGVLRGWTPEKITRWAKTSLKLFLFYELMDLVKLWRSRVLREERKAKIAAEGEGDEKEKVMREIRKEEEAWVRLALVTAAYIPVSVHWASEKWKLSDGWVGAFLTAVGIVKARAAWASTA